MFSGDKQDKLLKDLGIDATKYQKHNALADAQLLRDVYLKMQDN
jgi:DNA polymerase III epsilon subunit-like protein